MTGEYNLNVKPLTTKRLNAKNVSWRNATELFAKLKLDVDGKTKKYTGILKLQER